MKHKLKDIKDNSKDNAKKSKKNTNPREKVKDSKLKDTKSKRKSVRFDSLQWNNAETSLNFIDKGFEHDDMSGFLGLEELDGVVCNWEEDEFGKTLKFEKVTENKEEEEEEEVAQVTKKKKSKKSDFYDLPLTEEEMKSMDFIHVDDFEGEDGSKLDEEEGSEENSEGDEYAEDSESEQAAIVDESSYEESDEENFSDDSSFYGISSSPESNQVGTTNPTKMEEQISEDNFSDVTSNDGFTLSPESTPPLPKNDVELDDDSDESDSSFIPDENLYEEHLDALDEITDEDFNDEAEEIDSESEKDFDFNSLHLITSKMELKKEKNNKEPKDVKTKIIPSSEIKLEKEPSMQAWAPFGLALPLLKGLQSNDFVEPTDIQRLTLPQAIQGRDVVGAAETGSGKTLAFGLPILNSLAHSTSSLDKLCALILAPTRELALQIADHLKSVSKFMDIKIASVVGGLSKQKQNRLINANPNILVATPGRLWDLVQEEELLKEKLLGVKTLVIDEADRMVETGHFVEVKQLLDFLNKPHKSNIKRQTFVFSATLENYTKMRKSHKRDSKPPTSSLDQIFASIKFKDQKPCQVNLTSEKQTSTGLTELRVDCVKKDKDNLLHFLLKKISGRTIVFVNSIDAIRRLVPTLKLLKIEALALHADLEQKQRLNTIDKFKLRDQGVIIASDVAARGLDIPDVDQVIHYNLPHSSELYIHRSGRTARAHRLGASIILNSPDEVKLYVKLCATLKRDSIPILELNRLLVTKFEPLTDLAREIETLTHRQNKRKAEQSWFVKSAEAMDIELDTDFIPNAGSNSETRDHALNKKLKSMKQQLEALLKQRIHPIGTSHKYFDFNNQARFIADLNKEDGNGIDRIKLLDQIKKTDKKKKKKL